MNFFFFLTHELLYIPECLVPLLGRDLLPKLGAQVTFPPNERPTLQVGSTTYLLFLLVTPQDEWRLHDLPEGKPGRLNSQESKQQFPEVWVEDKPPQGCKTSSTGTRTQTRYNYVSICLGPARPCLAIYSLRD